MNSALKRVSKENADNAAPKLLIVATVFRDSVEAPENRREVLLCSRNESKNIDACVNFSDAANCGELVKKCEVGKAVTQEVLMKKSMQEFEAKKVEKYTSKMVLRLKKGGSQDQANRQSVTTLFASPLVDDMFMM